MAAEDRLASELITSLSLITPPYNSSTPFQVGTIFNTTLSKFIRDNVTILGSYSGMIPGSPPVPEVIPLDEVSITGELPPSTTGDFSAWIMDIETKLKTTMMVGSGITSPLGTIPVFPTLNIMITQDMVGSAYMSTVNEYGVVINNSPQFECMRVISNSILDALRVGYVPSYSASLLGTGIFTITSIKII